MLMMLAMTVFFSPIFPPMRSTLDCCELAMVVMVAMLLLMLMMVMVATLLFMFMLAMVVVSGEGTGLQRFSGAIERV